MRPIGAAVIHSSLVPRLLLSLLCVGLGACGTLSNPGKTDFSYKDMPIADGIAVAGEGNNILFQGKPLMLTGMGIKVGDKLRDVKHDRMPYSRDFRRKVLAVRNKEGLTIAEAAARFAVGSATVVRWNKNVEHKPQGYRRRKIDLEALRKDVIDYPDAYQHERAQRFGVAQNAIFFALKKLQLTYKNNASSPQGGRRRTVHLPR